MASSPFMISAVTLSSILTASFAVAEARVDAVAALNAELLSHDSATQVLTGWCAGHHLADPPVIRAIRDRGAEKPAGHLIAKALHLGLGEAVRFRHVRLVCGDHVLSEADNWYRPALLTSDMNRALDETDTPFGAVVKPLGFHRHTLAVIRLQVSQSPSSPPHPVLRHEAVLTNAGGEPFSLVIETYTSEILRVSP